MSPKTAYLHQILEKSALSFPDHIAIQENEDKQISYTHLLHRYQSIQSFYKTHQIPKNSRITFYCNKSIDCIASFFACSSLELIFVPVSMLNPFDRLIQIIDLAESDYIIIDQDNKTILEEITVKYPKAHISAFNSLLLIQLNNQIKVENLLHAVYILFTSGSTGLPKGVAISHEAALVFIEWCVDSFQINPKNKILSIAPFNFDLSVFDIYVTLYSGACLYIYDEMYIKNPMMISSIIHQEKINTLYATPTFYKAFMQFGKVHKYDFHWMKTILFAGEVFHKEDIYKLKHVFPSAQLYNLYGPTETNVCTYYHIPEEVEQFSNDGFPIGKACAYATTILVDVEQQIIQSSNQEGEIWVAGKSLFNGYWNDIERTSTAFQLIENIPFYKTGDIAIYTDEMDLVYMGRRDEMIKKNGYRIELTEIEIALLKHANIQENSCIYMKDKNEIICFYNCKNAQEMELINLKSYCMGLLPNYMIPDKFVYLNSIPITVSGKTDKLQLKRIYEARVK